MVRTIQRCSRRPSRGGSRGLRSRQRPCVSAPSASRYVAPRDDRLSSSRREPASTLTETHLDTILRALDHIHACGVVHNDLRLANVLVVKNDPSPQDDDETPMGVHFIIIDFSHATFADDVRGKVVKYDENLGKINNYTATDADVFAFDFVSFFASLAKRPHHDFGIPVEEDRWRVWLRESHLDDLDIYILAHLDARSNETRSRLAAAAFFTIDQQRTVV